MKAAAPCFDDLSELGPRRLARMRRARAELFTTIRRFRRAASHPLREVLAAGEHPFTHYVHYPPGNADDPQTGYLWYYHAHEPAPGRPWDEHGHFHLFCQPRLLAGRAEPVLPALGIEEGAKGGLPHLFGLSLSERGAPCRLFTINRWASNEPLYATPDLLPVIDRFAVTRDRPHALVGRWLGALTRLLHPQLAWLVGERDRVLAEHRARDPDGYGEDRALEVVSTLPIDLNAVYAALDRAG